jgi:hypothetical protein
LLLFWFVIWYFVVCCLLLVACCLLLVACCLLLVACCYSTSSPMSGVIGCFRQLVEERKELRRLTDKTALLNEPEVEARRIGDRLQVVRRSKVAIVSRNGWKLSHA